MILCQMLVTAAISDTLFNTASDTVADLADRWSQRYGATSVLFARVPPVARTFISLPAGASRIPPGRPPFAPNGSAVTS